MNAMDGSGYLCAGVNKPLLNLKTNSKLPYDEAPTSGSNYMPKRA